MEVGFGEGATEGAEFLAGCGEEEALEVSDGADKWRGCRREAEEGSSAGELRFRQEAWWGAPRSVHEVVPCEDSVHPEWGESL